MGRGSQEGIGTGRERAEGGGGGGVELQKIETANGNAVTDEESHVGSDTEDVVDYIPGERARSEETSTNCLNFFPKDFVFVEFKFS